MSTQKVTEADFRLPQYRDAKPEDYEFREDGALVRKDRWESAVRSISSLTGVSSRREFEISEVVDAVRKLVAEEEGWIPVSCGELPENPDYVSVKLKDGSVLNNVIFMDTDKTWIFRGIVFIDDVIAWKEKTTPDMEKSLDE